MVPYGQASHSPDPAKPVRPTVKAPRSVPCGQAAHSETGENKEQTAHSGDRREQVSLWIQANLPTICQISYNKAMKPTPIATLLFSCSIGSFWLERNARGLTHCEILAENTPTETSVSAASPADPLLQQAANELQAYLRGSLKVFSVPLDLSELTLFQQEVLAAVALIPWGQTRTYSEVAAQIGKPNAIRAVGNALAHNPLMLFVPCHRVIGSDGKLHGFSAPQGVALKAWLLDHESIKVSDKNLYATPNKEI